MDAADLADLDRVVGLLERVLGDAVRAVYLYGSAVQGGLGPHSDLDLLAVLLRPTAPAEKRALVDGLLALSCRPTAEGRSRPLEVTAVVAGDIRPWRYPPRLDFQYGEWLRAGFEAGELDPWPSAENPDLAVLLHLTRSSGRPLVGPSPGALLDPVPPADLRRAVTAGLDDLLAGLEHDTRNVVLTLARIWCTLATGEVVPKTAAADWALAKLPPDQRPVLERARAIHVGEEEEYWDDLAAAAQAHCAYMAAGLRRLNGALA